MRLHLHLCCATCTLYPVHLLRSMGVSVKGLWYNPNIHPFTEYRARLDALRGLGELWGLAIDYEDEYGLTKFLRGVVNNEENRCEYCYMVRLDRTAAKARNSGADAFSTSLLVSPYQKFDLIVDIGRLMQERHGIEFYWEDFRSGYKEGQRMSRDLGLYRQKYCGCIYSEMERYAPTRNRPQGIVPKGADVGGVP